MEKSVFALLTMMALGTLQAAQFQHDCSIKLKEETYEAQFNIKKSVGENGEMEVISSPQVICVTGQESLYSVGEEGDRLTIKTLVYKQGDSTKAKTSIAIEENHQTVYTAAEDFDVR